MKRPPDFLIGPPGDPYVRRWWVIPRNRWFNIYLHHFRHSDDDRALHDHPWLNLSILLRGEYVEHDAKGQHVRRAPALVLRPAVRPHRIELRKGDVWTLFITGPVVRDWGFHCPKGWVLWKDFVDSRDTGTVGAGCGD